MTGRMRRRYIAFFALLLLVVGVAIAEMGGAEAPAPKRGKVLVLGFDGMDPGLLRLLLDRGDLPNFQRLIDRGTFTSLGTSIPPQSPVAWSNFITGMDPGGHDIFDFIHRDPKTYLPFMSTSQAVSSDDGIGLWGEWRIPTGGGEVLNLRRGVPFWDILTAHGVPTAIFKIPANYPPVSEGAKTLSGLGTPDILGTPGTFTYLTTHRPENADDISGGKVVDVYFDGGTAETAIPGPPNPMREGHEKSGCPVRIHRDVENRIAKIVIGEEEVLLREGEWSDWVPVKYYFLPDHGFWGAVRPALDPAGMGLTGIARLYLKSVAPEFGLYVSPINIDPLAPAQPISTPDDWAAKIAEKTGRFYTQGMPEDTKALEAGILTDTEFLQQAGYVLDERMRVYDSLLNEFVGQEWGLLYYYFSSLDQQTHVMWRAMDPHHPASDAEAREHPDIIYDIMKRFDQAVGMALDRLPEDVLVLAMSDHGFAPWYREVHLNSWLADNGYLTLKDPSKETREKSDFFLNVDWRRTRVYALGINGLYINTRGREKYGVVSPGREKDALIEELTTRLTELRDPKTGKQPILALYRNDEVYHGPYAAEAPDMSVGYAREYRGSNESALGEFPMEWFADNTGKWSGDHCIDAREVPGILVSSREVRIADPMLYDLTVTLLNEFGIEKGEHMVGRPIF
ncbi:MAG: alkaline phosphatase family protein [Candidatus Eisenbacteria bacterium]|nr:alkaline phosphatase family protein [Candidatus Eisenbacteria bacterium]